MSQTKLTRLRDMMKQHNIQAYIIPSQDAHQVRSFQTVNDYKIFQRVNMLQIATHVVHSLLALLVAQEQPL
jgi:hypothetical protein